MALRKIPCYIADGAMDVVLTTRDVLKTLDIDSLTPLEALRAAGELKEMRFLMTLRSTKKKNDLPRSTIARGAKSLEPE